MICTQNGKSIHRNETKTLNGIYWMVVDDVSNDVRCWSKLSNPPSQPPCPALDAGPRPLEMERLGVVGHSCRAETMRQHRWQKLSMSPTSNGFFNAASHLASHDSAVYIRSRFSGEHPATTYLSTLDVQLGEQVGGRTTAGMVGLV